MRMRRLGSPAPMTKERQVFARPGSNGSGRRYFPCYSFGVMRFQAIVALLALAISPALLVMQDSACQRMCSVAYGHSPMTDGTMSGGKALTASGTGAMVGMQCHHAFGNAHRSAPPRGALCHHAGDRGIHHAIVAPPAVRGVLSAKAIAPPAGLFGGKTWRGPESSAHNGFPSPPFEPPRS